MDAQPAEQSWVAELRRIEWDLARRLDYAPLGPDIEFVAFLRVWSRFGFFAFGPVTIDVSLVEDLLLRTASRGTGGPERPPVSVEHVELSRLSWAIATETGRKWIDELNLLLTFMRWGKGLPARVFGELGVTAADVERYVESLGKRPDQKRAGERLLSTEETADYLGVHVQTIRGWIRSGKLPAVKLAGQKAIRIRESALERVLDPIEPRDLDETSWDDRRQK